MDKRRWLIGIGIAIGGAVVAAGGLAVFRLAAAPRDDGQMVLQGNVDIRQVSLAFDASARIVEMNVREGDRVQAGAVLARLDTRGALARLAQARAQVEVAESALRKLRAGSRPQEVAQARDAALAARADADLAQSQWQRLRDVAADTGGKGVSTQDLDAAAARRDAMAARWRSSEQAARLVEIGPRQEDIGQAQAQVEAARAQLALIQREVDESALRAPQAAVVRSRLLEPGDMASPQRPVYTLAIVQPKWVRAYLAESALPRVHEGDAASVSVDGLPGRRIAGKVGYIASVAEFTPKTVETPDLRTSLVYEIRVIVDDPDDVLRLGMPATVSLRLAPLRQSS